VITSILPENTRTPEILTIKQKVERSSEGVAGVEE
jgi:hypothetical protein